MDEIGNLERDMAPSDVGRVVRLLLEGIARGEYPATPEEVRFLESVAELIPEPVG